MEELRISRDNVVIAKDQFIDALLKCAEEKGCELEVLRDIYRVLSNDLKFDEGAELKIDYNHATVLYDMLEKVGVSILYLPTSILAIVQGGDVVVRTPWTDSCFLNSIRW